MSNILKKLSSASVDRMEEVPANIPQEQFQTPPDVFDNPSSSRITSKDNSVLTHDVEFEGDIEFKNSLTIHGSVKGSIHTGGELSLEKDANINAKIKAKTLTVKGKVKGKINVDENVQLLSNAQIFGDITAKRIKIEDGVTFVGQAKISK